MEKNEKKTARPQERNPKHGLDVGTRTNLRWGKKGPKFFYKWPKGILLPYGCGSLASQLPGFNG
jgi:hypothetical protein